ncbi:MAG TPA: long-chain fatty acid--CoA ligase [Kofleriaceae bacterium]|nr:long-chain fatty acid--CoA ligase [Kofleriaceae bacterium]
MATTPAPSRKSAVDVFRDRVARSGARTALRHKVGTEWQPMSWAEWGVAAREIAGGLATLGVAAASRVAILASTRLEWALCDVGVLSAGAVVVPIYPSSLPDQVEHILRDSGSSVVVAEDEQQLAKLTQIKAAIPQVARVVLMRGEAAGDWVITLAALREAGRAWIAANPARLDEVARAIDPAETATIIYTSGTTGPPKGVVLTHANLVFEMSAVEDLLGLGEDDEQLLFLPLAHSFARVVEWACIAIGASTAFAEGLPQLVPNMAEVRPTFVAAVPRVFEKAYAKMQATFAEKRKKAITRRIVDWSLAQGRDRSARQRRGEPAEGWRYRLADRLVFEKVRATFGGRLRYFVSGGAPLSAEIAEFFHAAGILVLEGYGLTETTAAATCNRPDSYRFGTVGPALPGVEIEIAADGEILIRGGNIMTGYWNNPAATAEVLDPDGWFHSGDIGVIEQGGHVRITDRKKDIIVTAGGKNVAPQNIENDLKAACPLVSQAVVVGDKQKYLVALLTLTDDAARDRAGSEKSVADAVARLNQKLASYETIKRYKILERDFTEESGELTPSLKVKRKVVSERHRGEIEKLYAGKDG